MNAPRQFKSKKGGLLGNFIWILIVFSSLILIGLFVTAWMIPMETKSSVGTNSLFSVRPKSLSQKLLLWLPNNHHHLADSLSRNQEEEEFEPDWTQEFWTPIDVEVSLDPMITLCKLDFQTYSTTPHLYAMFRDFVDLSECKGKNRKREKMSVLLKEIKEKQGTPEGRVIPPTGFVFHESRVGSTLVANSLASDPWSMVFSESTPTANALSHCSSCTRDQNIEIFRGIVTLMGRSPIHKRMFFKFQSITSIKTDIALEAFPDTPWAFVYRQPVQTMMSHLDPRKGSTGAPCLRSMRHSPQEVLQTLTENYGSSSSAPREAWCAAHLHMLCSHAIEAFQKYGEYEVKDLRDSSGSLIELHPAVSSLPRQRGLLINYDSLPGIIPQVMLPMFGVQPSSRWLNKMSEESQTYSKGKGQTRSFSGDSQDKDTHATEEIKTFADKILMRSYESLSRLSEQALSVGAPEVFLGLAKHGSGTGGSLSLVSGLSPEESREGWSGLRDIPSQLSQESIAIFERNLRRIKSTAISQTHSSKRSSSLESSSNIFDLQHQQQIDLQPHPLSHHARGPHSYFDPVEFIPWAPFSNTHHSKSFEPMVDCSYDPSKGYPKTYQMLKILDNWGTDDTEIPPFHYDSLCHFDYQNETQLKIALHYRELDIPFVMYNIPEVDKIVKKWSDLDYLENKLGKRKYRTETSKDNHFMYWKDTPRNLRRVDSFIPPTNLTLSTFEDFLELAVRGQNISLENRVHQYFRIDSRSKGDWLNEELPFLSADTAPSLMVVDPNEHRGIHCRFGMRNVIAEAHFDGSRNAVVMLGGLRRWILTHPDQCKNMHMYERGHPSGRHSQVDWSNPDLRSFPNFPKAQGNEVILQPGDFLYVPTFWIHYIVSLNVNYQCNARSGVAHNYDQYISDCGF